MPNEASLLVDTNAASAIMRANPTVLSALADVENFLVPCIVAGELFYGAYHASLPLPQIVRVTAFVAQNRLLYLDDFTLELYGRVLASLRSTGRLIPTNDMWIAALALQHNLPLMTQDRHFDHIEGLTVIGW
jgi:tRNA(fMet)-specific endonuclease VapC